MAAGDAPAERPALADEVGLPDELLEVRGRIRAASGWRSGGGWNSASGRAPSERRRGRAWAAMVARRARRRAGQIGRPRSRAVRTQSTSRISDQRAADRAMIRRTSRTT